MDVVNGGFWCLMMMMAFHGECWVLMVFDDESSCLMVFNNEGYCFMLNVCV